MFHIFPAKQSSVEFEDFPCVITYIPKSRRYPMIPIVPHMFEALNPIESPRFTGESLIQDSESEPYAKTAFSQAWWSPSRVKVWKWFFFPLPHLPILIYPLVIQQVARLRTGKWHIEIVDLPFFEMVIFHSHVSLPKGNSCWENDEPSKSEAFP